MHGNGCVKYINNVTLQKKTLMMKTLMMILSGIILVILLVFGGIALFLASERGQQWLYDKGLSALQETLKTHVAVGKIDISLFRGCIILNNVEIDDRQQQPMLRVDTLEGKLNLSSIWHREIGIRKIKLAGATARLYKNNPDTLPNYQFVIDELKRKKDDKHEEEGTKEKGFLRIVMDTVEVDVDRTNVMWDVCSKERKPHGKLDVNHIALKDFSARLMYNLVTDSSKAATLHDVAINEENSDMRLAIGQLRVWKENAGGDTNGWHVVIDSLHYKYNNHMPRKNAGRPHRGWFDPGHVTLVISTEALIDKVTNDSLIATVKKMSLKEKESGLDIRDLKTHIERDGDLVTFKDTHISMLHTTVNINRIVAQILHDKKRAFVLKEDCPVSASVILKDIARPFAPPLYNFTTPLRLYVTVAGDLKRMLFKNIRVTSSDGRLALSANGDMCNTLEKRDLCLHFNGIHLSARGGIKEQIVSHFAKQVRLKMMRQMAAIGDIAYSGSVGIFYKREDISGLLTTKYGNVKFAFTLNGKTKYMTGTMATDAVDLGSIMNIKGLWVGNARASYSFNTSRKRGRSNGGRLPQGWLRAEVDGAKYKILHFQKIHADMTCDGAEATGTVNAIQKLLNVSCDFVYRQTDKEQSFRVKPHFSLVKKQKNKEDKTDNKEEKVKDSTESKSFFKKLFSRKKNKKEID